MEVHRATPLYEFLRQCDAQPMTRVVLDCGAGGPDPPLALFHQAGYKTYGIEIAREALEEALAYSRAQGVNLTILPADMRHIPFPRDTFSFAYSFNTIFFMTEPDIALSVAEIERVFKPGGLCYANFKSVDEPGDRPFSPRSPPRRLLRSQRFSKHSDDEADKYFRACDIVWKQKTLTTCRQGPEVVVHANIEYIAQKRPCGAG